MDRLMDRRRWRGGWRATVLRSEVSGVLGRLPPHEFVLEEVVGLEGRYRALRWCRTRAVASRWRRGCSEGVGGLVGSPDPGRCGVPPNRCHTGDPQALGWVGDSAGPVERLPCRVPLSPPK